jgi:para-nitrobenzyl esterase
MNNFKYLISLAIIITMVMSCTGKKNKLLDPVVETEYGKVQGAVNETGTVVSFKGIPYAAPPVGDLRWREPQPPVSWEGVRDATKFCANCVQVNNRRLPWTEEYMIRGESSEDCLFLNIWTPAKTSMDNLPVLVYIHGGGLREGSGAIDVYDGEELAKKGIVVVTINYRVGAIGFLAHPWLSAESPHNASGNYGFMDQIASLKWIKANIAAFGGNPEKITVAGQSAGSRSVHQLTASPLAEGLICGAVTMSGASMERISTFISSDTALARGVRFAKSLGVTSLEELRAKPATDLIADFSASIDGYVLPESMVAIFEKGLQNDVPAIAGLVSDEGSSREGYGKGTVYEFIKSARETYGERADKFLSLYPVKTDEEAGIMSVAMAREKGRVDLYEWALFRAQTAKTPAFTYYFSRGIPWPEHPEFNAFHTGDVIYWFNNLKKLDRPWTQTDTIVAETASSYLVNFVIKGDPNGEGLPPWPAFEAGKAETMELGSDFRVIPVASEEKIVFFKNK